MWLLAPESPGKGVEHSSCCSCRDARRHLREQPEPECFPSSPRAAKSPWPALAPRRGMTTALPELPAATGASLGAQQERGVQPGPPLQCWGTGGGSEPCPAGRGTWSHCTYQVPCDQGDTAPCQPMPHEGRTGSPGPGGVLPKPRPRGAQPAPSACLRHAAEQMSLLLFTLLKP